VKPDLVSLPGPLASCRAVVPALPIPGPPPAQEIAPPPPVSPPPSLRVRNIFRGSLSFRIVDGFTDFGLSAEVFCSLASPAHPAPEIPGAAMSSRRRKSFLLGFLLIPYGLGGIGPLRQDQPRSGTASFAFFLSPPPFSALPQRRRWGCDLTDRDACSSLHPKRTDNKDQNLLPPTPSPSFPFSV